ncbi:MAG: hypothetical protein AABW68_04745 [archaeon]
MRIIVPLFFLLLLLPSFSSAIDPFIITDYGPYTSHITSWDIFTLDVNYLVGNTCTIIDNATQNQYSTVYVGNGIYRNSNMAFGVDDNSVSIIKQFSVNCSGNIKTSDSWKIKIDKHELITSNGSFDVNCTVAFCNYFTPPSVKPIGLDMDAVMTGGGEVKIWKDTSSVRKASTGKYYAQVHIGEDEGGTSEVRPRRLLNGGTVYFDVNSFTLSGTGSGTFKVNYYYPNGDLAQTLVSKTSGVTGKDKNVSIPNFPGYIGIGITSPSFKDSGPEVSIDDIRYYRPDTCESVVKTGESSDKIDVVFVGSGFPNLNKFSEIVNEMVDFDGDGNGLMAFTPFREYRNKFNFWRVDTLQTFDGGVVQYFGLWNHDTRYEKQAVDLAINECGSINEDPPIVVTLLVSPKVTSHAYLDLFTDNGLGNLYLTIGQEYLDNSWPLTAPKPPKFPSLSIEYGEYGTEKWQVQRTLVHEFGHSFGGLADEYDTSALITPPSFGTPNCDDNYSGNACFKWSDICTNCCIQSCGYPGWYRPYENSIMRYQASEFPVLPTYGEVNEFELEQDINEMTGFLALQGSPNSDSYFVELNFSDPNLSLLDISVIDQQTNPSLSPPENGYRIVIESLGDDILYDHNFTLPSTATYTPDFNWFDENGNQIFIPSDQPIVTLTDFNFSIAVPFFINAKNLKIYDENQNLQILADVKTNFSYNLGYGTDVAMDQNYSVSYVLIPQSVSHDLQSTNYIGHLGPILGSD